MNKFAYFITVGLAFMALQVSTVEADMIPGTDCAATEGGPDAVAACFDAEAAGGGDHPCSGMTGDALITCTEENPPPSGTSEAGGPPTLTLEDPQCQLAPADRDPGCPTLPATMGDMEPPMCGDQPCPPPTGDMEPPMCGDQPCPPPTGDMEPPMCGDQPCPPPTGDMEPPMCGDQPCPPPTGDMEPQQGADPSCMPLADGSLPPHCN